MEKNLSSELNEIIVGRPVDKTIRSVRVPISSGRLALKNKLPSASVMRARFCIGIVRVREAVRKREFHYLLNTLPQSGTISAGLGSVTLERHQIMLDHIVKGVLRKLVRPCMRV